MAAIELRVGRGRLVAAAGLGSMLVCAETGTPVPESTAPTTPVIAAAPTEEPETAKAGADDEPPELSPSSGPCWRHRESRPFEDCLRLIGPGEAWTAIAHPRPPFGYVCMHFGYRRASCEGMPVRLVRRWTDGARDCARVLSLYWAPEEAEFSPGRPLPIGSGRPSEPLRPYAFDSDGTHFVYLRVDDYVIEGEVRCLDHAEVTNEALVKWGRRLQPQIYDDEGNGRR